MIVFPDRRLAFALSALFAIALLGACSRKPDTEGELMKAGLDALYARNDSNAAADQFRKVLERNPTHYGATFQLAMALDRAGKPNEARPLWEKMFALAAAAGDAETATTARARLGKPGISSEEAIQEAMMKAGLDLLYTRRDPTAAAAQFRKALERNPNHYGANFQLAYALDQATKRDEARPLWEKVLKMAEGYNDKETAATARARLAARGR